MRKTFDVWIIRHLVYVPKNFVCVPTNIDACIRVWLAGKREITTSNLLTMSRYYANQHLNDKLVGESVRPENWLYLQSSIDWFCWAHTRALTYSQIHRLKSCTVRREDSMSLYEESTFWHGKSLVNNFGGALIRSHASAQYQLYSWWCWKKSSNESLLHDVNVCFFCWNNYSNRMLGMCLIKCKHQIHDTRTHKPEMG